MGVVMAAAHEGSEHAEQAERRDIGDATLEQLRADVVRLSQEYNTGEPLPVFIEMTRVRRRIWTALERRLWPRDQTELHFLLGILHGLMALCSNDLGNQRAAEELIRTGWAYARTIDHHPLMGQLRLLQSTVVYWADRPRQSSDLARMGQQYLSTGPHATDLYLKYGRARARLGDVETARRAISAAREAHDPDYRDDVVEIGGEFKISTATQTAHLGATLVVIPDADAQREAITELERAVELYAAGPARGEHHYWGSAAGARIDLAAAWLNVGELDAAMEILEPVLLLPPNKRVNRVLERLQRLRPVLATTRYRGAPQAADLDERIETFHTETIVNDLRELPAGPG
jgi:hypothetical protein